MRIVEEKPFEHEFECPTCKSRLVAEAGDVKFGYFGANYGGDTSTRECYVTCPVCGTDKVLDRTDVTPKVREQAEAHPDSVPDRR